MVARTVELLDCLEEDALIAHDGRLRQLEVEVVVRDAVALRHLLGDGKRVHLDEVERRQVDGDRHERQAVLLLVVEQPHYAADHEGVELVDKPRLLEYGDDDVGRDHAVLRVLPAHQRFDVAELARQQAHAGLQVDLDMPLPHGLGEMRQDVVAHLQPLAHLLAVDDPAALRVLLGLIAGHLRLVERRCDRRLVLWAVKAQARLDRDARHRDEAVHLAADLLDAHREALDGSQCQKRVRRQMCEDSPGQGLTQHEGHVPEQVIARRIATIGIVELEVRDVEVDGTVRSEALLLLVLLCLVQRLFEKALARQESHLVLVKCQTAQASVSEVAGPVELSLPLDEADVGIDAAHMGFAREDLEGQVVQAARALLLPARQLLRDCRIMVCQHHAAQDSARQVNEVFARLALEQGEHHAVVLHDMLRAIRPHQAYCTRHLFIAAGIIVTLHSHSPKSLSMYLSLSSIAIIPAAHRSLPLQRSTRSNRYVCVASGYF